MRSRLITALSLLGWASATAATGNGDPYREADLKLEQELDRLQNPADCSAARLLVVVWDAPGDGLGSFIHTASSALAEGYYSNRTVIFAPHPLSLRTKYECPKDMQWRCFFKPLSDTCRFETLFLEDVESLYKFGMLDSSRVRYADQGRGNVAFYTPPPQYRALPQARRWWASRILARTARLRDELEADMASIRERLGWEDHRPVIGVHVRHGDSIVLQKPNLPFSAYADAVRGVRAKTGASSVWVASDDDAIDRLRADELQPDNGWRVMLLDRIRVPTCQSAAECPGLTKMEFPFTYKNDVRYGTEALEDMWLLSYCDHQIGTISSHFSVIPALLRFARDPLATPPIYLDIQGARNKRYQIGMLRSANLGRGKAADDRSPLRWRVFAGRFAPLDERVQSLFAEGFRISKHGIPEIPYEAVDAVVGTWANTPLRAGVAPLESCGGVSRRRVEDLVQQASTFWSSGHMHAATACAQRAHEVFARRAAKAAARGRTLSDKTKRASRVADRLLLGLRANQGASLEGALPVGFLLKQTGCLPPDAPPAAQTRLVAVSNYAASLYDAGDKDVARACFGYALRLNDGSDEQREQVRANFKALGGTDPATDPVYRTLATRKSGGGSESSLSGTTVDEAESKQDATSEAEEQDEQDEDVASTERPRSAPRPRRRRRAGKRRKRKRKRARRPTTESQTLQRPTAADRVGLAWSGGGSEANDVVQSDPKAPQCTFKRRKGRNLAASRTGAFDEWPRARTAEECERMCESLGNGCLGYVFHTDKFADPWRRRCIMLSKDAIDTEGLRFATRWARQPETVSGLKLRCAGEGSGASDRDEL